MSMKVEKTTMPEVLILTPKVFDDERGFFLESYNKNIFEDAGISQEFVQDTRETKVANAKAEVSIAT